MNSSEKHGSYFEKLRSFKVPEQPSRYRDASSPPPPKYPARDKLITFVVLILLWQIFYSSGIIYKSLFPSPVQVFREIYNMFFISGDGVLLHIGTSFKRFLVGFTGGYIIAFLVAVMAGINDRINNSVSVVIDALYNIPHIAYFPIFMLLFGLGEEMRYLYVAFLCLFRPFFWTRDAVREFGSGAVYAAKIDGANIWQILFYIVLPLRSQMLFRGMEQGMRSAWGATFISEFSLTMKGLGFLAVTAETLWDIERSFAILFIIYCMVTLTIKIPEMFARIAAVKWPTADIN